MDSRLQRRVQRYGWDAAAPHYSDGWATRLRPAQDEMLKMAGLAAGQEVLETACGTGLVTQRIAEAVGPEGRVLATDLSEAMVEATRALGLANVAAERMGAEDLDSPDRSFDRALCALGLMYVPDPLAALKEMHRVLRPGGKAAVAIWGERRRCGWAEIFPIVDAQVASEVCPMFFASGAPGALRRDFEAAGFSAVAEQRLDQPLDFPDARVLLDAMLIGGPVALAVKRFDEAQMQQVRQAFLDSVADYRQDDGGYRIPGEFVVVTGEA